jgi:hypothetical protein
MSETIATSRVSSSFTLSTIATPSSTSSMAGSAGNYSEVSLDAVLIIAALVIVFILGYRAHKIRRAPNDPTQLSPRVSSLARNSRNRHSSLDSS